VVVFVISHCIATCTMQITDIQTLEHQLKVQSIPVLILDALLPSCNHVGSTKPKNSEKPKMQIFLDEFMSTNCRFDTPTAMMNPGEISNIAKLLLHILGSI